MDYNRQNAARRNMQNFCVQRFATEIWYFDSQFCICKSQRTITFWNVFSTGIPDFEL